MFSFGPSVRISSPVFQRQPWRRGKLRHWLALALIAIAAATFNDPAPAEMSSGPTAPVAAVQQQGRWSIDTASQLIAVVEDAAKEGLDPADYRLDALRAAIASNSTGAALDAAATASALSLAHDFAYGRIDDKAAFDWYIAPQTDASLLAANLDNAVASGRVADWLRALLPDNEQYNALKTAYAATSPSDGAARAQLRANLERWRWMPRALGERYIYVNIPSYRLEFIENGIQQASYNVVVGAPKTPTPQLALQAQSVVANPSWILPPSVLKEGGWQRKGYRVSRRSDGSLMVRQAPGPRNALGRIKIDMPNPMAIYLHDTPYKGMFDRADRALSHGCIRVQNIEELAGMLSEGADLADALAEPAKTRVLQLQKSVPVYIVYFTAQADADGTVSLLSDPYRRDQALIERLDGSGEDTVWMAAR
ncbi:L,D-transpeptidase family protein [Rhizorhabdus argentea]|uniref:L,D-transpeptidase family protein n=1 Tax=Rhizorhabdus argentea TaxID=1387174 RepID=UPI0030EEB86A